MFRDGMEDMAFERLKDLQRERENSRLEEGATFRLLGLLTEPWLRLFEGFSPRAGAGSRPAPRRAPRPRPAPRG